MFISKPLNVHLGNSFSMAKPIRCPRRNISRDAIIFLTSFSAFNLFFKYGYVKDLSTGVLDLTAYPHTRCTELSESGFLCFVKTKTFPPLFDVSQTASFKVFSKLRYMVKPSSSTLTSLIIYEPFGAFQSGVNINIESKGTVTFCVITSHTYIVQTSTIKSLFIIYEYLLFQIHAAKLSIFPRPDKFFGRKNFTRFHKKQIEK